MHRVDSRAAFWHCSIVPLCIHAVLICTRTDEQQSCGRIPPPVCEKALQVRDQDGSARPGGGKHLEKFKVAGGFARRMLFVLAYVATRLRPKSCDGIIFVLRHDTMAFATRGANDVLAVCSMAMNASRSCVPCSSQVFTLLTPRSLSFRSFPQCVLPSCIEMFIIARSVAIRSQKTPV